MDFVPDKDRPSWFSSHHLAVLREGKAKFPTAGSVGDDQLCIPWDLGSEEAPITFILPVPLH